MLPAHSRWLLPALLLAVGPLHADEARILRDIAAFFGTRDAKQQRKLARRIESDPAYDPHRVRDWLHRAVPFKAFEPGLHELSVPLAGGVQRRLLVRIPRGYDPHKAWPLIYALHGQGGRAEQIIRYIERILAGRVEQYIVAAPDQYLDAVIHQTRWPPTHEHPAALHLLRHTLNLDSDRIHLCGYSRGGHTSWTLAVLHADQFAAAMPLAGTLLAPEIDALWDELLPNLAHTPVFCVWGELDALNDQRKLSPDGGIAGLNRRLREHVERLKLPVTMVELPGIGHGGVIPPAALLDRWLSARRAADPLVVRKVFRHIGQAGCWWIEPLRWAGSAWDDKPPRLSLRPGEDPRDPKALRRALVRWYHGRLGELRGERHGNRVRIYRRHIRELVVWFGLDSIDYDKPVELVLGGRTVFHDTLSPSLYLCLTQARRTYDFERLRWAGLHYRSGSRVYAEPGR